MYHKIRYVDLFRKRFLLFTTILETEFKEVNGNATNNPASSWLSNLDTPSWLFGVGFDNYELYEEDDEFVLTVDMPGFDREDIHVNWDEGRLFISAEHNDP